MMTAMKTGRRRLRTASKTMAATAAVAQRAARNRCLRRLAGGRRKLARQRRWEQGACAAPLSCRFGVFGPLHAQLRETRPPAVFSHP